MPRILLVFEYPTMAGGERSVLAAIANSGAAGLEFMAAAPATGSLADAIRRHGLRVWPFAARDGAGRRLSLEARRRQLARIIEGTKPDLIHANSLSMGRLAGPVAAALAVPGVAHLRDIIRLSRRAVADLNHHNLLLAVSRATRDYHVAAGLSADRTVVLPNGVDLREFRPRPSTGVLLRELALPAGVPLIGTIVQISLRKGVDVLIRAARRVVERRADAHFLVIGERYSQKEESRRLDEEIRRDAAAGALAGHVHFLGYRHDVADLLAELALLVHPARQEPLGRVLLEAGAAGVPVLATAVGGTTEIFPPGQGAACLVPPDDPATLAREIVRLLNDPRERRRMGAAARRRIADSFDIAVTAPALVAQYWHVLHNG